MNKQQLEQNLKQVIELYNSLQKSLHSIYEGVKNQTDWRRHLDDFLDYLWLEKNEETRFAAYTRIVSLHENALELYLEKNPPVINDIPLNKGEHDKWKQEKINKSYEFVAEFHSEIQAVIISVIEAKALLTPFYLEIFKWVANVWLAFNDFFMPWRNHIVKWINKDLEKKFDNDSDKIIDFLNKNDLFDKGHGGEQADRSYSALVFENWEYKNKAYVDVFPKEILDITKQLDSFIIKLSSLEDEIYSAKDDYINYLKAIKVAFLENDTSLLVEKWAKVDEAWMSIKTPFQIGHPLEFYEDKYRKAVAPEWDLRIINTVFESDVEQSIENMYEKLYDDIGSNPSAFQASPFIKGRQKSREYYNSSYNYSLSNMKRVQLYLTSPVLYYSSELTWLFSAQVVPNDEVISKAKWKKIFAFPEMVLENKRSTPFMKIDSEIFEEKLLYDYRKSLFWDDKEFYKIYDIETIGHEYGHTLWLDLDTEIIMNKKTWVYKNIEEYKATMWWIIMYFMSPPPSLPLAGEELLDFNKKLLVHHIIRCINLLKYREVNEIEPYYCESLIHLSILKKSEIISFKENKVEFNFSSKTYYKLKELYISNYKKLIYTYLEKIDAMEFLWDYTIKKDWNYLPKEESLRLFVDYYYDLYKRIGNSVDDSVSKDNYK